MPVSLTIDFPTKALQLPCRVHICPTVQMGITQASGNLSDLLKVNSKIDGKAQIQITPPFSTPFLPNNTDSKWREKDVTKRTRDYEPQKVITEQTGPRKDNKPVRRGENRPEVNPWWPTGRTCEKRWGRCNCIAFLCHPLLRLISALASRFLSSMSILYATWLGQLLDWTNGKQNTLHKLAQFLITFQLPSQLLTGTSLANVKWFFTNGQDS